MVKNFLLVSLCFCSLTAVAQVATGQDTPSAARIVVYKWIDAKGAHYSTQPPHGVANIVKLDERGLVIRDDNEDMALFNKLKPVRPTTQSSNQEDNTQQNNSSADDSAAKDGLPAGAVTKAERCKEAQSEIQTIESTPADKPINVEDENGNLLPMSNEERQERLQSAKALVERLCDK